MKGHVFEVRIALFIDALSATTHKITEIIRCTYKNINNVKRCLDRMKDITLRKPKPYMGDNGVTSSKDLVETKIFKYQIHRYGNGLNIMKNMLKAAY